jgi:hypothetical protein
LETSFQFPQCCHFSPAPQHLPVFLHMLSSAPEPCLIPPSGMWRSESGARTHERRPARAHTCNSRHRTPGSIPGVLSRKGPRDRWMEAIVGQGVAPVGLGLTLEPWLSVLDVFPCEIGDRSRETDRNSVCSVSASEGRHATTCQTGGQQCSRASRCPPSGGWSINETASPEQVTGA